MRTLFFWRSGSVFQSTLPARGATSSGSTRRTSEFSFQSTLPARGATQWQGCIDAVIEFQSTLPARGATTTFPFKED